MPNLISLYEYEPEAVNYYHKALHLGCCNRPRSASMSLIAKVVSCNSQREKSFREFFFLFSTIMMTIFYKLTVRH